MAAQSKIFLVGEISPLGTLLGGRYALNIDGSHGPENPATGIDVILRDLPADFVLEGSDATGDATGDATTDATSDVTTGEASDALGDAAGNPACDTAGDSAGDTASEDGPAQP